MKMSINGEQLLPMVRVAEIPNEENAQRWLVEQLCRQGRQRTLGGLGEI